MKWLAAILALLPVCSLGADGRAAELARQIRELPLPDIREARPNLPDCVVDLLLRCLAKKPADRPQTAEQLAADLAAVPLPSPWSPERARAWWDANLPGPAPGRSAAPDSLAETMPLSRGP